MGIRRHRKKWRWGEPKRRWEKWRLIWEKEIMRKYGIRRKREIWLFQAMLRNYRGIARKLIGKQEDPKAERLKRDILRKLYRLNLIPENATLDDVFKITIEDILKRRLAYIVYSKGLAKTPFQARQFIVHGHIMVGDKIIRSPNYLVKREEEDRITYSPYSPFNNSNHPIVKEIKGENE